MRLVLENNRASLVFHDEMPIIWVLLVGQWGDLGGIVGPVAQ